MDGQGAVSAITFCNNRLAIPSQYTNVYLAHYYPALGLPAEGASVNDLLKVPFTVSALKQPLARGSGFGGHWCRWLVTL